MTDTPRDPSHTRFRKGQSGNPKGRPRKSRSADSNSSPLEILIQRTIPVGGESVSLPLHDALLQKTFEDALAGKRHAMRKIVSLIVKREQARRERQNRKAVPAAPLAIRQRADDPRDADAAMEILGIVRRKPLPVGYDEDDVLLEVETWAAQAALNRRRTGHPLTYQEIDTIRFSTIDGASLTWPAVNGRG